MDVTFVLCVEDNPLKNQATLLIQSIREFTGIYRNADILAISPRGCGIDLTAQADLRRANVHYVDTLLNSVCPQYGSANRLYAGAWAAQNTATPMLVVLDTDTVFLNEPEFPGPDVDVAARPVDLKGIASAGPQDPFDLYWQSLCDIAEVPMEILPYIETSMTEQRIRASYNGGYLLVRRESGILEWAAEIFTRSVAVGLRPLKGRGRNIVASTGPVGPLASEYWGSNQAALSLAIWSRTRRVQTLDRRYNIPLHLLLRPEANVSSWITSHPTHVHYHWVFGGDFIVRALEVLQQIGTSADRLAWLRERTPID
jgi:hypothetical protein